MLQVNPSDVVDLRRAAGVIEEISGHRPHVSTIWRWWLRGRLRGFRVGSRVFTTRSALREMLSADAATGAQTRERLAMQARGEAAAQKLGDKKSRRRDNLHQSNANKRGRAAADRILNAPPASRRKRGA